MSSFSFVVAEGDLPERGNRKALKTYHCVDVDFLYLRSHRPYSLHLEQRPRQLRLDISGA